MAGDRAPGASRLRTKNSWFVESAKELSRQQSLGMNFRDCQLET